MPDSIPRIMILMNPARGYDRALMRGMARYAHTIQPVMFFQPPPFWEQWDNYSLVQYVKEIGIHGLILIEQEALERLRDLKLPMVVSPYKRRRVPGVVNIITRHQEIGRLAGGHLMECGFKQFAFCGYRGMFWSEDRLVGFKQRLREAGFVPQVYPAGAGSPAQEKANLIVWLEQLELPAGIFACLDERGRELLELCISCGLHVPDEVGVMGVDDDALLCDLAPVPLSTIANTAERCGYEAVKRIVRMCCSQKHKGLKPDIVVEPTHCVGRLSTDFINTDDPALAQALRFIRTHARKPLLVEDVVEASGLSRRILEQRFRKNLGISIYKEVRRTRVALFARLLLESNRTVAEIAEQLGFANIEHVSRYFKSQTGKTPREYRLAYGVV